MAVSESMKQLKKGGEIIMRYGGDEFVVLGKVVGNNHYFEVYQDLLNRELEEYRGKYSKSYQMSVSVGFYSVRVDEEFRLDVLIENADKEMYKKKREISKRK